MAYFVSRNEIVEIVGLGVLEVARLADFVIIVIFIVVGGSICFFF